MFSNAKCTVEKAELETKNLGNSRGDLNRPSELSAKRAHTSELHLHSENGSWLVKRPDQAPIHHRDRFSFKSTVEPPDTEILLSFALNAVSSISSSSMSLLAHFLPPSGPLVDTTAAEIGCSLAEVPVKTSVLISPENAPLFIGAGGLWVVAVVPKKLRAEFSDQNASEGAGRRWRFVMSTLQSVSGGLTNLWTGSLREESAPARKFQ